MTKVRLGAAGERGASDPRIDEAWHPPGIGWGDEHPRFLRVEPLGFVTQHIRQRAEFVSQRLGDDARSEPAVSCTAEINDHSFFLRIEA
jgi:hypothetical protein